jgi:predicted site-specific integrase-resolvase
MLMQILLTKREAAAALNISIRQLELYVRDGSIAVKRLGRRCVRVEPGELERFVARVGATETAAAPAEETPPTAAA